MAGVMNRYKIIVSILLLMGVCSCSNYLNVTPKNVISMDDMVSIKQSLSGFMYNVREDGSGGNSIPSSPFESPVLGLVSYTGEWDLSKYAAGEIKDYQIRVLDWRDESTQYLWSNYYSPIGFMNLIIYESAKAKGDEAMRDYVMGEAYAMRAYCFFKLVQYFSPYKDNAMGIPVCLETYEDFENVTLERKTQQEVYAQILSDLDEAAKRLERTASRNEFNLMYNASVVNRLYAAVYHFKAMSAAAEADDWENAIAYADRETNGKTLESDPSKLRTMFNAGVYGFERTEECPLRLWTSGRGYSFSYFFDDKEPDQTFYLTYFPEEEGDIRRDLYYQVVPIYDYEIWDYVYKMKIDKFSSYSDYMAGYYYLHCGFRLAETFLIQAEAYAMCDRLPEAAALLRRFKESRYTEAFTVPDTKDELLADIYRERKKEFVAEGDVCWLDMKRLGVTAERTVGGVTYKLTGGDDYRYTFPIPLSELDNNKFIRQNPGWNLND